MSVASGSEQRSRRPFGGVGPARVITGPVPSTRRLDSFRMVDRWAKMTKMKATTGRGVWLASFLMLLSGCTRGGSTDRSQASSTTRRSTDAGDGWPQCGAARGRPIGCFATPTGTESAMSVTTTSATARACRASDLRVTSGESPGAGGTAYTGLGFTNRSTSRCTLAGHPRVSFLDRSGRVLGRALPTPGPETVTVSPGQYATTALGVGSTILGACQPSTPATLRIVLPSGRSDTYPRRRLRLLPRSDCECPAFLRSIYGLTKSRRESEAKLRYLTGMMAGRNGRFDGGQPELWNISVNASQLPSSVYTIA